MQLYMQQPGDAAGSRAGQKGRKARDPGIYANGNQSPCYTRAQRERAVYRQIREPQNPIGNVHAHRHNSVNQAFLHYVEEQTKKNIHSLLPAFRTNQV